MPLVFKLNPELQAREVAALRRAVGWEGREEKIKLVQSRVFSTAACFAGQILVGYIEVISDGVEDGLIRNLIVHPDYQRRGVASKLLKIITAHLKSKKIKTINVLFELEHEPLYQKAGFRIVGGGLIDNETEGF